MEAIDRDKLTVFIGLPLMYQAILDHPRRKEFDLSSLRTCMYTMAPMPRPLLERCIAELCPNFVQPSGQTEMYPATTMSQPDRQLQRFGNYWGESMVVNETAIMDDNGNLLPPGEVGELVHRGPNVMMGYYKDPKATEEARKFGWHHTGDLALIDEHGEVLFLDRKKDMINRGGYKISSTQVEEVLHLHPSVVECAVVGRPDDVLGERLQAFIWSNDTELGETALRRLCVEHLPDYKVPEFFSFTDAPLPRNANGKILKRVLRESLGA